MTYQHNQNHTTSHLSWPNQQLKFTTHAQHETPFENNIPFVLHTRVVTGTGGGPEKTILRSPKYANQNQFRMAAAYIHPKNDPEINQLKTNAQKAQCPIWTIGESGPADPRTLRQLLQLCKKLNVTVWHSHDYKSNLLGLLLKRRWNMKLITTVHGWTWDTTRARIYYHIDNWCLPRYDHVIAVSPKLVNHCKNQRVNNANLTYIPNAIDPHEYQRQRNTTQAKAAMGIPENNLVIGVVSRFSIEKGIDRAIKAFALLQQKMTHTQLHLFGDGPMKKKLEALSQQLGIAHAVRFWGWQQQTKPCFEMMDTLLLPSLTEGLPNTVLEAMALGVPVAATNVGAITDLLDHGHCGIILNQDHTSWPERIAYLLTSPYRRARIATLARARIENHYSFQRRMNHVFDVYRQVLGLTKTTNTDLQTHSQAA